MELAEGHRNVTIWACKFYSDPARPHFKSKPHHDPRTKGQHPRTSPITPPTRHVVGLISKEPLFFDFDADEEEFKAAWQAGHTRAFFMGCLDIGFGWFSPLGITTAVPPSFGVLLV